MGLELINDIINKVKESNIVENFIEELTDYLSSKGGDKLESGLKKENTLYQVVDFSSKGVYLKDITTNKVFEETEMPQELKEKLGNDYILSYKDGKYVFEEEITDRFMNSLVSIGEYQKIKNQFEKETNILELSKDTVYKIEDKTDKYSILKYDNDGKIEAPNELIPFFAKEGSNLYYKSGKFQIK